MSPLARRGAALAALLVTTSCADRQSPLEPRSEAGAAGPPVSVAPGASVAQLRHERLARRFALALHDADFRASVYRSLQRSQVREGKVHLQRFLGQDRGPLRQRFAQLAAEPEARVAADLDEAEPIEIYLPVPEHRRRWRGDRNLLVATAEHDRDAPVAFDLDGRRRLLSPDVPPDLPVIALGRAELAFPPVGPSSSACATCDEDPDGGGGSSGAGTGMSTAALTSPGLYMTYTKFNSTFEGWLKGAPEFEVHILGQDGTSNAMRSYQCAGETAGGPYFFNQDEKEWSGRVMLFSQAQLDAYQADHPGQSIRVFIVEDDDGPCVIKTDSARVARMFQQLITTYGVLTGGKDDNLFSVKTFHKAVSLFDLFKSVWSFILTQDDVVGNAIEDSVVGEYFPGANWIVKGENGVTNGAIRLEMR